jgi:hypothetical protein
MAEQTGTLSRLDSLLAEALREYQACDFPPPHGIHVGDALTKAKALTAAALAYERTQAEPAPGPPVRGLIHPRAAEE